MISNMLNTNMSKRIKFLHNRHLRLLYITLIILFLVFDAGCSTSVSVSKDVANLNDKTLAVINTGHTEFEFTHFYLLVVLAKNDCNAASAIEERLVGANLCRIVDRNNLDKILEEKRLTESDLIDANVAITVGKLAGLDTLLTVKSESTGFWFFGLSGDQFNCAVRLIDVSNGQIIASGRTKRFYPSLLYPYFDALDVNGSLAKAITSRLKKEVALLHE